MKNKICILLSLFIIFEAFGYDNNTFDINFDKFHIIVPNRIILTHSLFNEEVKNTAKKLKSPILEINNYTTEEYYKLHRLYFCSRYSELTDKTDEEKLDFMLKKIREGTYPIDEIKADIDYSNYKKIRLNNKIIGNYVFEVTSRNGWVTNLGSYTAVFEVNNYIYELNFILGYQVDELKDKNMPKFIEYNKYSYSPTKYDWTILENYDDYNFTIEVYKKAVFIKSPDLSQDIRDFQQYWEEIVNSLRLDS